MKINIISIGKFKQNDPYKILFEEYKKRTKFDITLKELISKKSLEGDALKAEEGRLILENAGSKVISLDERGKIITTSEFKDVFEKFQNQGITELSFVIGGSDGLSQEVRDKSDYILSLGKMVFPHLMVRVILMEQLYRIFTLQNNHPYHK